MKEETRKKLYSYVDKNTKPFEGITRSIKEIENMQKSKLFGKEWFEKDKERGFYPQPAAIKSVQRKSKAIKKALDKRKQK